MFNIARQLLDLLFVVFGAFIANLLTPDTSQRLYDARGMFITLDIALVLLLFPLFNLYQSWRGKTPATLIGRTLLGWVVVQGTGALIYAALHRSIPNHSHISHAWFINWTVLTALSFALSRQLIALTLGKLRSAGFNQKRVVIVGTTAEALRVVNRIERLPQAGYSTVAIYDEAAASGAKVSGVPVISRWNALTRCVRQGSVTELWLTGQPTEAHPCARFIAEFRNEFVNIRLLPDLDSFALANLGTVDLLGLPSINLVDTPVWSLHVLPKEIFDRVFAAAILIALLPLFAVVACAIKISSPGPVLFRQKRKGIDGNEFSIYKFRSMRMHTAEAGVIKQATKGDSRITRVGAILRKTSIDELPQFINVLKGEMSVVGPRPHAVEHDELYKDLVLNYMYRYRIKPGITGWAQVNGFRGETDRLEKMVGRVACDLYYMRNWTFWLDVKIVMMAFMKGFVNVNAY